jgi:hypothetical protein
MATQPEFEHPNKAFGWAARDTSGVLSPFNFSRRFIHTPLHFFFQLIYFLHFDASYIVLIRVKLLLGKYITHL